MIQPDGAFGTYQRISLAGAVRVVAVDDREEHPAVLPTAEQRPDRTR
ncbi:hypothetical protein [Streptomyces mashuensis]|nr:hypothetical protein [Streptomyces mashuensis]